MSELREAQKALAKGDIKRVIDLIINHAARAKARTIRKENPHDFGWIEGHDICITKDGRNLHDEGYCDVTGQDYNEWRG